METAAPSADTGAIPESFSSPDAAARFLISRRNAESTESTGDETDLTADGADDEATADTELSDEGNAAPDEDQAPGEDVDTDPEAEELPPIERPRSWAKEDQAEWDELPRSLQEKLAARETDREKAIRKGQNDAADKLKGLSAKEQAAEQARQQYENQARNALKILERDQQRDFPDIRTMDDVNKLAQTDPLRFLQWQAHQMELASVHATVKDANDRDARQKQTQRISYATEQDAKLKELVPEFADPKKLAEARDRAIPLLEEYGLSRDQLGKWVESDAGFELLQHAGFQHLIADMMNFRDAKAKLDAAKVAAVKKPVPTVQRPGVKRPQGSADSERAQAISTRLNSSGSLKDATALLIARRAGRR